MDIFGFHFHSWKLVKDTGLNKYYECRCGKRKVDYPPEGAGFGYQPVDFGWVTTGKWTKAGPPPTME